MGHAWPENPEARPGTEEYWVKGEHLLISRGFGETWPYLSVMDPLSKVKDPAQSNLINMIRPNSL